MSEQHEVSAQAQHEVSAQAVPQTVPHPEKPVDFEPDLRRAIEEGKLSSVWYLIEVCHCNIEVKDKWGRTPFDCSRNEAIKTLIKSKE